MTAGVLRTLTVEFLGEVYSVGPGDQLSFGRCGDIQLDTNEALPTVAGCFQSISGMWWVANTSMALPVEVLDHASASHINVAPQGQVPVGFSAFVVRLQAGAARYELEARIDERSCVSSDADRGSGRRVVSLNDEQRQLLTLLAEAQLRGQAVFELPSNAEAAERLGWKITKLNRKLDHLCVKFDKLGVPGLRGSNTRLATSRRQHLVEHCLLTGIVTAEDLVLLPELS